MHSRQIALACAAIFVMASSAAAQSGGTFELGTFGSYAKYGDLVGFEDKIGGGGRLGFFFLPRLELEAASTLIPTRNATVDITHVPIYARLVYNQPLFGGIAFALGGGYVRNQYAVSGSWTGDNGWNGLVGLRLNLSNKFAFRIDGTADYLPELSDFAQSTLDNTNLGLHAGLSLMFGNSSGGGDDWYTYDDEPDTRVAEPMVAEPNVAESGPDTDSDGVLDGDDRCYNTPLGTAVDDNGCALPGQRDLAVETTNGDSELDSDADGVYDSLDLCPATATGTRVDSDGCAIPVDTDGDGVLDPDDRCPYTALDAEIDASGCPVLHEEYTGRIVLQGVTFAPGRWEVTPNAEVILNQVAASLKANPSLRVEIAGYTDNLGARSRNVWLSQTRADAVKLYLTQQGISKDRMVTRGYGPDSPVADNSTEEGRARNRRVELNRMD